ncbi:hypothetical protein C8R45DRAFT_946047 [Mycena sanguinolenta]|nr:hypothetical protein C8R45DRAFT_946047 [Mycena sanguinolenta]
MPFVLGAQLCVLTVFCYLTGIYGTSAASCGCLSLIIPVHVDIMIPKNPADPFGGLKSNASSLRPLNVTYDVFGVFCQTNTVPPKNADVIQLLFHGFTYTQQYWSPPTEEFRNYSYTAFACDRGMSTLAIDWVGVGLSSRPTNASDMQYATGSAVASQLANRLKTTSILPGVQPFKRVIGIGHSAGSVLLNFGAIFEGARFPFDGLILTAGLIVQPSTTSEIPSTFTSARDDTPLRWRTLDPDYITTSNRSLFYPANPTSFSPRMLIFDTLTKDVGSLASLLQLGSNSLAAEYTGPVAKVVGSEDQALCADGRCADVAALNATESVLWPEAKSFEVVVAQGSGHDMNLDFFADGPFNTFVNFVEQFTAV